MCLVALTRARFALATSILTVIAAASAQEVDERARAAAGLEPAPWAEPEGAFRSATIQDPALLRQVAQSIEFPVFDDVGDGAVWVLGRNYKARIDAGGFTFVPFLGSRAPRNFPVSLSLASASLGDHDLPLHFQAQPVRDGARIWVDHGSITEVFDVAADSIEQSFVVHRGSSVGELDVRLDVETDLRQSTNGLGTWFTTPGGGVHYGLATTLDAHGSELVTTSLPVDRALEFLVPAAEVARAVGDLTIDPILATVNLEPSTYLDDRNPDVAYDVSNDRYIVIFERVYSANDHDVFCQMVSGASGQPIANTWTYIDFTSDDWRQTSVGNLNAYDQFLVAASVRPSSEAHDYIKCRVRLAATVSMGPQITISPYLPLGFCAPPLTNSARNVTPVVGGDSSLSLSSRYCVAWMSNAVHATSSTWMCSNLLCSMVGMDGSASTPQTIYTRDSNLLLFVPTAADGNYTSLAISKSAGDSISGASQEWNLAWRDGFSGGVWGARIRRDGVVTRPAAGLVEYPTTLPGQTGPWSILSAISVSTSQSNSTRQFLITWDALDASGTVPHLYGAVVDPSAGWGAVPSSSLYDLTQIQGLDGPQWQPSVDCDGTRYLVAFNAYPGGITGLGCAEFGFLYKWFGAEFRCFEPMVQVATSNFTMGHARTCTDSSGGGTRRNALIGTTRWGGWGSGGYYGGDPLVALHTH